MQLVGGLALPVRPKPAMPPSAAAGDDCRLDHTVVTMAAMSSPGTTNGRGIGLVALEQDPSLVGLLSRPRGRQ
jgi:hypothetical protein